MSQMLILNPAPRRKARKSRKAASPAQRRARANFAAAARARSGRRRRRNPAPVVASARRVMRRRRNPLQPKRIRNPINRASAKLGVKSIVSMLRDAAIGGAGAVGMDVLMGKINPYLPASMQTSSAKVGAGDAVKAALTVLVGKLLSKPTKGLSQKMAMGALTTQARDLISGLMPASMTIAGMGYASPAMVTRGSQRVGPIRSSANGNIGAYIRPGQTPMLNAYQRPGGSTALLSRMSARQREGSAR